MVLFNILVYGTTVTTLTAVTKTTAELYRLIKLSQGHPLLCQRCNVHPFSVRKRGRLMNYLSYPVLFQASALAGWRALLGGTVLAGWRALAQGSSQPQNIKKWKNDTLFYWVTPPPPPSLSNAWEHWRTC
jgi:hypothetical protein